MISDFFGVEPNGDLAVKSKMPLQGGGELLLRPLSLEKLFALMHLGLPAMPFDALAAMEAEEFLETFAAVLLPAVTIATGLDASAFGPLDVPSVVTWYMGEHDWKRIYSEIICPDGEPSSGPGDVDAILDLMFAVEIATEGARPVESQLRMRPEAWLSTLEAMERRANRVKTSAPTKSKPGDINAKRLSMDQLFAMLPGGETLNVQVEPGEGEH